MFFEAASQTPYEDNLPFHKQTQK